MQHVSHRRSDEIAQANIGNQHRQCDGCLFWTRLDGNKLLGFCEHPERDEENRLLTDRLDTCGRHQEATK